MSHRNIYIVHPAKPIKEAAPAAVGFMGWRAAAAYADEQTGRTPFFKTAGVAREFSSGRIGQVQHGGWAITCIDSWACEVRLAMKQAGLNTRAARDLERHLHRLARKPEPCVAGAPKARI